MQVPKKIVCLMGPTASGKTQLAIDLLREFPFEIISVDSALVYKGMDIGTAKPSKEVLKAAPHHLIDIRDPADAYSAAQFRNDALKEIANIIAKNKIPLLVGGTMLYFKALQKGLSNLPSADETVRTKILERAQKEGWQALHEELKQFDPEAAARIHAHDAQRIQRAFEVYEVSGKSITSWQQQQKDILPYDVINIAIAPQDRAVLHERIATRFQQMLTQGFLEEVKQLQKRKDLSLDTPSIRSVGYRQAWEYLQGDFTEEELNEKAIAATRQFAKRQLTWLRHWPFPIEWFDSEDKELSNHVSQFLKNQLKEDPNA